MKISKATAISTVSSVLLAIAVITAISVAGHAQTNWQATVLTSVQTPKQAVDSRAQAGSVILYSFYASNAANPEREDTFFSLTNHHATQAAFIRLLFVNRRDLETEEYTLCLPATQTMRWRASELDPGITGHVFAIAADAAGRPLQFNWLTGTVGSKNSAADIIIWQSAFALAKHTSGVVLPVNQSASLLFDGTNYDQLPEQPAKYFADSRLSLKVSAINCPGKPAFTFKPRKFHTLTRRE